MTLFFPNSQTERLNELFKVNRLDQAEEREMVDLQSSLATKMAERSSSQWYSAELFQAELLSAIESNDLASLHALLGVSSNFFVSEKERAILLGGIERMLSATENVVSGARMGRFYSTCEMMVDALLNYESDDRSVPLVERIGGRAFEVSGWDVMHSLFNKSLALLPRNQNTRTMLERLKSKRPTESLLDLDEILAFLR